MIFLYTVTRILLVGFLHLVLTFGPLPFLVETVTLTFLGGSTCSGAQGLFLALHPLALPYTLPYHTGPVAFPFETQERPEIVVKATAKWSAFFSRPVLLFQFLFLVITN